MPLKALGLACAVVALSSPIASAQVDFDELFDSLAFSDEAPPAPEAPDANAPHPSPVPTPPPDRNSPDRAQSEDAPTVAIDAREWGPLPQLPDGQLSEYGEIPDSPHARDTLHARAEPPVPPAETATPHRIDFAAVFSEGGAAPTRLWRPARRAAAPPRREPFACGFNHATAAPDRCEPSVTVLRATPCLERPNLPPPASLEAFYRTPACYRDLWSGYAQQRQRHCQCVHQHLHGHCECLESVAPAPNAFGGHDGWIAPPAPAGADQHGGASRL